MMDLRGSMVDIGDSKRVLAGWLPGCGFTVQSGHASASMQSGFAAEGLPVQTEGVGELGYRT